MANVKISPKGKALLKRGYASSRVVNAIVKGGDKIFTKDGMVINVDGKQLKVRAAASNSK